MASSIVEKNRPELAEYEELYKHLHANPELSTSEFETSALVAERLKKLSPDLEIRTGIGGTGLIAILKNGAGKTVLLRADMDGLPVKELTDLPYASKKTQKDRDGVVKSTMHACGHDTHITCLLAATEIMLKARSSWSGTCVFLFQPSEERANGAKGMIDDGLYEKHGCPVPDVVLGQHVIPFPAGEIGIKSGPFMSAADSFRVTIYGRGGHGSQPHASIDPVVIASHVVIRLQTIVSREVPPDETAVVTVGAIQAGNTENIISSEAMLLVNVRTFNPEWRTRILASVRRIIKAECDAGNCPKEPLIEPTSSFPLTDNDHDAASTLRTAFSDHFGQDKCPEMKPHPGSEDFGILGSSIKKPYCFWFFGGVDPKEWEDMVKKGTLNERPVNHSPYFAPSIGCLKTGIDALAVAALTYVGKKEIEGSQ